MAKKGSSKARSVRHEEFIAEAYQGQRSPSSGAAETDEGDVRTKHELFECKLSGGPKVCMTHNRIDCSDCARTPVLVQQMEKVADEAWSVGRTPALALRYYAPESVLSDREGYVDLTVRLVSDDVMNVDDYPDCPEGGIRWR